MANWSGSAYGTMGLLGIGASASAWCAPGGRCTRCGTSCCTTSVPGTASPETYTIPCLTFDLAIAAYIAVAYGIFRLDQRSWVRSGDAALRQPAR